MPKPTRQQGRPGPPRGKVDAPSRGKGVGGAPARGGKGKQAAWEDEAMYDEVRFFATPAVFFARPPLTHCPPHPAG